MTPHVWLIYYCVGILLASVFGGMLPVWFRITHRWMEIAVSFVAGIMFGVAVLHLLPHALVHAWQANPTDPLGGTLRLMVWFVVGFLAMFFIERFFCFHHHDPPAPPASHPEEHVGCEHHTHSDHVHDITWSGAAVGLTLHSLLAGVALAASVAHGPDATLPGVGAFLVVFLHKPFDSMTISTLMARSGWSVSARCVVNALFSLAVPVGALAFSLGLSTEDPAQASILAPALAFSAGVFLCIAGSDLLPELQFHHHDRMKLSLALLAGLGIAYLAGRFESGIHRHPAPDATNEGAASETPPG